MLSIQPAGGAGRPDVATVQRTLTNTCSPGTTAGSLSAGISAITSPPVAAVSNRSPVVATDVEPSPSVTGATSVHDPANPAAGSPPSSPTRTL